MGGRGGSSGLSKGASKGRIKKAKNAKNLQQLNTYMFNKFYVTVEDQSLSNHDFETVRNAAVEIEALLTEFPQAVDRSIGMLCGDYQHRQNSSTYADASLSGVITLNDGKFQNRADLLARYERDVKSHWHPEGTTGDHIVTHEMGHLLERALIQKLNVPSWREAEEWSKSKQASRVVSEACKIAKRSLVGKGLKNNQLIEQVSRYATKNRGETLAECVADYRANGVNAKPLSIAVWGILKRELG